MVNRGSDDFNEEQWYPRLPDGYDDSDMFERGVPGFPSDYGMPGYGMPGYGMPGYGMHGDPSWQGMTGFSQGQGRPGFPPGQRGPGFPPGQGGSGFPPGQGGPGFPPGQGGPGFPPGQQQGSQPPRTAPPSTTPTYPSTQLFAVDPGAIRGCLHRFTFVWLSRRQGFWFYPDFVGRRSVSGWRWRSRLRRWEYTGISLDSIDRFSCY